MGTTIKRCFGVPDLPLRSLADSLAAACRKSDSCSFSYPSDEENTRHYFLLEGKTLLAALALVFFDENEPAECVAFTHPDHRRHGFFSRLLTHARRDYPGILLLFSVNDSCAPALAVLRHLDAKLQCRELSMELDFRMNPGMIPKIACTAKSLPDRYFLRSHKEKDGTVRWKLYTIGQNPRSFCTFAGSALTSPAGDCSVCFHQVEIRPTLRGRGLGGTLLRLILTRLADTGTARILLHVSADNLPAVSLYKKTGFRVRETLSFYLYQPFT
ncbi:MAG: GNAT family N-acetyltransferase [Clostridiales bacterium]|nr:GNAT family N-acetyltransferase [Clostridiales bacterium]